MKNLVIVESPTKARTISRFLGPNYEIKFSMGHVMDLPKSKMGIDMENNFQPLYEVMEEKKKVVSELRSLAKNAEIIYLATDPDREGEAISANIQELLTDGKGKLPKEKFKRIVFHEITEEAIIGALEHPRAVDDNLVNAQTARRVLDRLVGYKLSPLLWKKVRRGLSAGRVQSVALRLIVEREREIQKFGRETYYTIFADLHKEKEREIVRFDLFAIDEKKIETKSNFVLYDGEYTVSKTILTDEQNAAEIVTKLKGATFSVADVIQKQAKRSPNAPFTTSTLQQDASRRFGFPGKRTMSLAQKLYEEGYITYHRTDSVILADSAITAIRSYVKKEFGDRYIPESVRMYTGKQKLAQEAHEAIRPTKIGVTGAVVSTQMGPEYGKLYDLIWRRTVASQMSDALIESTSVFVNAVVHDQTYTFKANGSVLAFDGFLKINPQALQDTKLPKFETSERLIGKKADFEKHETPPPPRYNDASLIGTLEERGIGRPSTYAAIISTLTDRTYIERIEKRFVPTSIGMAVNDFLVTNFSTIDDIPFTAEMEDELDSVASGKMDWVNMMREFYTPFEKKLEEVAGAERIKIAVEETGESCPECKEGKLVVRHGKFGKFLSCNRFPDCKFTRPFVEETNVLCPKDGAKIVVKKTKKGRKFYGCSSYPNCDFAAWNLTDIKKTTA